MKHVIWKMIPQFRNYEINALGQVRSYLAGCRYNPICFRKIPKTLKPWMDVYGYQNVTIRSGNRIFKKKVHHLVLDTFIGPRKYKHECAHLNGIRSDNRLENLRWVTCKENQSHRLIHGTDKRGEKSPHHKLKKRDVIEIIGLFKKLTPLEISKKFCVSRSTINNIKYGITWKWLTKI